MAAKIPSFFKPLIIFILKLFGMKRESLLINYSDNPDLDSLNKGCLLKEKVCREHMEEWKQLGLDCMILPATGMPPLKHGQSAELMPAFIYTAMINVMDYPAGIIPDVVKVTHSHLEEEYTDCDYGNDQMVKSTKECLEGSVGLGMAIQVVTMTGEEEKCLGIMKSIDRILKK